MVTRRQFGMAGMAMPLMPSAAKAQAPAPSVHERQAPAHYRLMAGSLRVTALCDGYLDLPRTLFPAAIEDIAAELARAAFMTPGPLPTAVNAFAVEAGNTLLLIDAGVGPSRGPSTGRLPDEMRKAGIDPARVSAVLLSHLHTDHCGGLLDASGGRMFADAEIMVSEPELRFWADAGLRSRAPDAMQPMIRVAQKVLDAYRGRVRTFVPGAEIVPGIRSVPLFGHTPGQTGFILGTGDDALFIWADTVHVAAYQFAHPDWGLSFDVDQAAAAATRARVFAQVASDRMRVAGMHLAFPGIGNIVRDGTAYRYVPAPWQPLG